MVCLDTNEEESSHLGFHLALKLLPANLGHLQFFARIIMCLISSSLVHVREMYIVLKREDTEHLTTPVSRHPKIALKQSRHRDLCSFFLSKGITHLLKKQTNPVSSQTYGT